MVFIISSVGVVLLCLLISPLAFVIRTRPKRDERRNIHWPDKDAKVTQTSIEHNELQLYKTLYFKLHNLEKHSEVLPEAQALLLSLFSEAIQSEEGEEVESLILSIKTPSASSLESLVYSELRKVTKEWHEYLARRKQGEPRKLFQDFEAARRWLVQQAPLRLVDGAWLGHIHKITTPFAYRKITRAAWQVLSEELGDGDLTKCHAHVFAQLLKKIGMPVPSPDSEAFIKDDCMKQIPVWRAALGQLLISLFPNDFLPEILGFNLNFEMLTMETLLAAKELKEVGIDPSYFTLHITIDNADSGHTAMASRIVADFLELEASLHGEAAARRSWKRVQAGYLLSKNIHKLPSASYQNAEVSSEVIDLLVAKSTASQGIHEHCPVRIGGRSLSVWLDPASIRQREWQVEFLQALANSRLICKGNSSRSRLIRQFLWGGSMFGALTDAEVALIKSWIDSLGSPGPGPYHCFIEKDEAFVDYSVQATGSQVITLPFIDSTKLISSEKPIPEISRVNIHKLVPLWLAHSCLLESAVSVPWNVSSHVGSASVRLLRAQYGFLPEPTGVNGLDEMSQGDRIDLVDIGLEMLKKFDTSSAVPESLEDALKMWPSPFTQTLIAAATKPRELQWVLLGMTQAFTKLHETVVKSSDLLSEQKRSALKLIAQRERRSLGFCKEHFGSGSAEEMEFNQGHSLALDGIRACFD